MGNVALVTSASRGGGKAIAREYGFTDVDGKQQSALWDEHWAGTSATERRS